MGIKRLKKVFVITGDENSGKTRCIKELARMFHAENYQYTDLLHTRYAEFLNRNPKLYDMNDDIFGYFYTPFDCIGILSAGDNDDLTRKMFELLLEFQPDVIILAARDIDSLTTQLNYVNKYDGMHLSNEEKKLLQTTTNNDLFHEENAKCLLEATEKEEQESDELKTLDDLFEEIKSAIRGFSYKK